MKEKIMEQEKIYTQEDLDNITNKVRSKYEEKYVSKEEYNKLQSALQEKENLLRGSAIKEEFIKNGGIENAFNDFLESNKSLLQSENLSEELQKIKDSKQYFFKQEVEDYKVPNEEKVMKDILSNGTKWDWNYLNKKKVG